MHMSLLKLIFGRNHEHNATQGEMILEINCGVAYESGDFSKAMAIASEGINQYPHNSYLYYLRGCTNEQQGNWDSAIQDFKTYLKSNKDHYNAFFRIGLCYQNSKRNDQALKYYNLADKYYENFDNLIAQSKYNSEHLKKGSYFIILKEKILSNRAIVKSALGDSSGAIADCTTSISINSEYPNPYFIRGVEYFKANLIVKAKSDLSKASALGYSLADQVLLQLSNNGREEDFFSSIKTYAEGEQAKQTSGGTRLRVGFETDLRENLSSYGVMLNSIPQQILLKESVDYALNMWNELRKYQNIDENTKAFILFEISVAIKRIRPDINQHEFWINSYNLASKI